MGSATPVDEPAILHVDMDAFFANVELLRHPELRGQPVVVGGTGERGVVAAASYEARRFGIHSAMPAARARRLCPQAVFLPGDHAHYGEVSQRVMDRFRTITPLVEPISLDEAFLDVSGVRRLHGPPRQIAARLRTEILDHEGLTCSVGVARVKFLAKLASEAAKPSASPTGIQVGTGVCVVDPADELAFLHPLPVQSLWGVGPVTLEKLMRIGVRTVGDLAVLPVETVTASVGRASGRHLHALANAVDPRSVVPDAAPKSVSQEETFPRDHHDLAILRVEVLRMADGVASRLRANDLAGRTVTLKVRFGDFRTITRSSTLDEPTDSAHRLSEVGRALLDEIDPAPGVRLLGLGVTGFGGGAFRQLSLDDLVEEPSVVADRDDWSAAEDAVEAIRARFGERSVGPASLTGPDGLRVHRRGDQQWGPDE